MKTKNKFLKRRKQPKAQWTKIKTPGFKSQQRRLHPEKGAAGGVKVRSASEEVRMAIYRPIAEMYKRLHPSCEICVKIMHLTHRLCRGKTDDIHHTHGREGWLLVDTSKFLAACRLCHDWIKENPKLSRELGLDFTHKASL